MAVSIPQTPQRGTDTTTDNRPSQVQAQKPANKPKPRPIFTDFASI